MNSSTPARNLSAVSDPRTEHTKSPCDVFAGPGRNSAGHCVGKGKQAGHYIQLHPELESALSAYAKREGIKPETAIAEAVRAYLGIEDHIAGAA